MNIIAAAGSDWGIGYENKLLFSIPRDMKFFRETTKDSVVIMGRKTLESFPGGNPLKNRVNIVLTKNKDYKTDALVCSTKQEVYKLLENYSDKRVFVIGGASIYKLFEDDCDTAYITRVQANKTADSFLNDFDKSENWRLAEQSDIIEDNGYKFTFCKYVR